MNENEKEEEEVSHLRTHEIFFLIGGHLLINLFMFSIKFKQKIKLC